MISEYLKELSKKYNKGDAREESYYSTLETLLKNYSEQHRKKKIDITTLPKATEAGNPDFRIWDGKQDVVGYIEAKDVGKDLDTVEDTEQLKRYLKTFPNVILTNITEFRLYRDGKEIDKAFIAYHKEITKLHTAPVLHNEEKFFELLNKFFSFSLPRTFTAKTLAVELAKRTRFLKDEIVTSEIDAENEEIVGFYEAFKEYLIGGLSEKEFADLYSQTITYGLFAARLRAGKNFNRREAIKYIPKTIGILRDVFRFISGADLPLQMETIVDDISAVLAAADAKKILDQYYREGKGSDPILHFYETFLAEYDPETREKRGVYYTPDPAVSFIVRSLHIILKEKFDKPLGLADKNVTLLDPAGGTLSFNAKAIQIAIDEFVSKYGEGGKKKFIKGHILENFYAFELMMAPYAIGHMKLSFLLEELGYVMNDEERAKFYLTNTLEMKELEETKLPGMSSLSHESHEAGKVKKIVPILVVHGNPPYSSISTNKGEWITDQIENYKYVDGEHFKEKKHWLQDDYVKFIRFGQWKIDQLSEGILAFITNHSYLDNPTFRGMRQSLMNSFDEIYILDLHGNSLKKEKCPDGSKDENVFDIQQGVSIALFVKRKDKKDSCKVFHSETWGLREQKYRWLLKNDINTTKWKGLFPKSEFYLFIPRDERLLKEYESYPKIIDIFIQNSVGIVTARDNFVIDSDKEKLKQRIRMFIDEKMPDEYIRQTFNLEDKANWKLKVAREKVRKDENWQGAIQQILYRPFDIKWIFYHDAVVERSRKQVMCQMMNKNLGLITNRHIRMKKIQHTWVASIPVDYHIIETASANAYLFPLYLYPEKNIQKQPSIRNLMLFEPKAD